MFHLVTKTKQNFFPFRAGAKAPCQSFCGKLNAAPFGEPFVEQRKDWGTNYKFNGKELYEETGYYYYGARYYTPDLSIWLSVDMLSDKFPGWSPYAYTFNNPINFIDPDGNEGVKVINHDSKTITIKANYYVQTVPNPKVDPPSKTSYDRLFVKKMEKETNSKLNNAKYKVTEGDYSGYSVKFELKFFEGGPSENLDNKADNAFYEGVPIGNTYRRGSSDEYRVLGNHPNANGVTANNKDILIRSGKENLRTRIHEIFHTLFFDRDGAESGIGNYDPGIDLPNQKDINILINNNRLPTIIETKSTE